MTRKHFEALARAIGSNTPDDATRARVSYAVAIMCKDFNPNFSGSRFLVAVEKAHNTTLER